MDSVVVVPGNGVRPVYDFGPDWHAGPVEDHGPQRVPVAGFQKLGPGQPGYADLYPRNDPATVPLPVFHSFAAFCILFRSAAHALPRAASTFQSDLLAFWNFIDRCGLSLRGVHRLPESET